MRYWRVVSNFHSVGEVVVFVQAPNWVGGLRKGALAVKKHPSMKGRRITVGAFTVQEIADIPTAVLAEQLPLAGEAANVETTEQAPQPQPEPQPGVRGVSQLPDDPAWKD